MIRREASIKRGGISLVGESHMDRAENQDEPHGLDWIAGADPSPEFAIALVELTSIAIAKMNGFNNREISDRSGVSLRRVERKLKIIRTIWTDESANDAH